MAQDYPAKELIVVDDGEDNVADLIPNHLQIRYLCLDRRHSLGAKRNSLAKPRAATSSPIGMTTTGMHRGG